MVPASFSVSPAAHVAPAGVAGVSATPVMYMDVDGVWNFFGSRSAFRRAADAPGYLRRTTVFVPEGGFTFNWSAELVRKFNELPADWMWLTSWAAYRDVLDRTFDVSSVGSLSWGFVPGGSHAGKFEALVADQAAKPRPFVWVDDEATRYFDAARVPAVPYVIVRPDENFGVTRADLALVAAFVADPYGFVAANG